MTPALSLSLRNKISEGHVYYILADLLIVVADDEVLKRYTDTMKIDSTNSINNPSLTITEDV